MKKITKKYKAVIDKSPRKKAFTLRVGGWVFYCDEAWMGQEKLARHQAEVISKALSKDAALQDAAIRSQSKLAK